MNMNWSPIRFVIYIIGIGLTAIATFSVAKGWATYDSVTNTLDPNPINLTTLAASIAGLLSSGTAAVAWLKNLSRK